MAVINAMCAEEHPTQAIADLATLQALYGGLRGLRILYVGEGNSTAEALVWACSMAGIDLFLHTPPGYGVRDELIGRCGARARGSVVEQCHDMELLPAGVDVVYTTRWQTTGTSKPDPAWRVHFRPFQVDEAVMARYQDAHLMHDLPAYRGEEVTADVLDGPACVAFKQARYKLFSAMAVLEWCLV
jgi:ornithine carbamoyltransferase